MTNAALQVFDSIPELGNVLLYLWGKHIEQNPTWASNLLKNRQTSGSYNISIEIKKITINKFPPKKSTNKISKSIYTSYVIIRDYSVCYIMQCKQALCNYLILSCSNSTFHFWSLCIFTKKSPKLTLNQLIYSYFSYFLLIKVIEGKTAKEGFFKAKQFFTIFYFSNTNWCHRVKNGNL